jgi:hypothetical protein
VFVEFAVNGGPNEAMEGIIRQIRQYNPAIDICLLYTATSAGTASYVAGNVPLNIANLEKIAVHYNIPSIHLALQPALLESQGLLLWKAAAGTVTTKIIFSNDGVHPTTAGGDLYAEAIARAMEQLKQTSSVVNYTLPTPLYAENWEDAGMYSPNEIAQFSAGWTQIDPFTRPDFVQFAPWFPYVRSAAAAGEYYTFTFTGKSFGFFDIGGPEVGQVEICVDGQNVTLSATSASQVSNATLIAGSQVATLNRFNVNCNNRYRGQFNIINVPPGTHTVKLSVSPVIPDKATILGAANLADITANPSKYNQHVLYLGKILIRGTVQKNDAGVGQISQSNPKVIASKKQIRISDCQDFNFADLYLSTGRWVQRLNLKQRTTIAVDSGVYFVRIFSDNRQYASKVMVL